jgi:excisionase family DNA binding protein
MKLSLNQAADQLGKTRRQIRYMIEQGQLPARKDGGRWVVEAEDLPLPAPQRAARDRREDSLRDAADRALGPRAGARWGLRDLKALQIGIPLYHRCMALTGDAAAPSESLRTALELLAIGCYRFAAGDKRDAYQSARDAVARAALALAVQGGEPAEALLAEIERELLPAIAGALRRTERRREP